TPCRTTAAALIPAPAPITTGFAPTSRGRRDSRKRFLLNALCVITITFGPRLAPRSIVIGFTRSRKVPPLKATSSPIVRLRYPSQMLLSVIGATRRVFSPTFAPKALSRRTLMSMWNASTLGGPISRDQRYRMPNSISRTNDRNARAKRRFARWPRLASTGGAVPCAFGSVESLVTRPAPLLAFHSPPATVAVKFPVHREPHDGRFPDNRARRAVRRDRADERFDSAARTRGSVASHRQRPGKRAPLAGRLPARPRYDRRMPHASRSLLREGGALRGALLGRPAGWLRAVHFGAVAVVTALSPSTYDREARRVAAQQIHFSAWRALPGFTLACAVLSFVLIRI